MDLFLSFWLFFCLLFWGFFGFLLVVNFGFLGGRVFVGVFFVYVLVWENFLLFFFKFWTNLHKKIVVGVQATISC